MIKAAYRKKGFVWGLGFQKDQSPSPQWANDSRQAWENSWGPIFESQSVSTEQTGDGLSLWTLKTCPQWHTLSGKVIPPKPTQTVPSIRDQVLKGLNLWGIFVIQTTTKIVIIFLNSLHTCRENKMKNNANKYKGEEMSVCKINWILLHEIVDVESHKAIHCPTFPKSKRMGKDSHEQICVVNITCAPSLLTKIFMKKA